MERPLRNAPTLLLAGALAASAVLMLALTWEFTFLQDTWEYLMNRQAVTPDTVLAPHGEHIVAIPVLSEQFFLHVFGMGDARPEYVLMTVALIAAAFLFFVYVRRRVGPWPALFATVVVLLYGPAWETLLWPFELCFVGSVLFGIAMLLALERDDRSGDLLACACLVVAIAFSSLGLAFAAAALVACFQGRRRLTLSRVCVLVVPLALYAAWYVGWGHEAATHVSPGNVLDSPLFVAAGLAFTVASLLGLGPEPLSGGAAPALGAVLLLALAAAVGYRLWRRRSAPPVFWPIAAVTAAYWLLAAFNQAPGRLATASRYQYAGAILLLMALAALFQGERLGRRALLAGGAVAAVAVGFNLFVLKDGRATLLNTSALTRADTGAIEIARRTVAPQFQLTPEVAGTTTLVDVFAGPYLEATEKYGSPAYSPAELESAPAVARRQADIVLAAALPISTAPLLPARAGVATGISVGDCAALPLGTGKPEVRLVPGTTLIALAPGPAASLSLRRFATGGYPVALEPVPGGSATRLQIPRDGSSRPWFLRLEASQSARVCRPR